MQSVVKKKKKAHEQEEEEKERSVVLTHDGSPKLIIYFSCSVGSELQSLMDRADG